MATCSDWNLDSVSDVKNPLPELRILMIGKTGQGKSTTANSILNQNAFRTSDAAASCTTTVESKSDNRFGCHIRVTDTPGFFDTAMTTDFDTHPEDHSKLRHLLLKSLLETTPGLDAILFVVRKGEKFTPEMKAVQTLFFEWFGPGVEKHFHLVLTHCKSDSEARDYFCDGTEKSLLQLKQQCGGRVIPIDNKGETKDYQVQNLVDCIKATQKENDGKPYKEEKYEILKHIAETVDSSDISPASLEIMKRVDPTIKSFLNSMNSPGNLRIFDDSKDKSGLFFPPRKDKIDNHDGIPPVDTTDTGEKGDNIIDNHFGIPLVDTTDTGEKGGNRIDNHFGIPLVDATDTGEEGGNISNNYVGIPLVDTTDIDEEEVNIIDNHFGIPSVDTNDAGEGGENMSDYCDDDSRFSFVSKKIRLFRKKINELLEYFMSFFEGWFSRIGIGT